MYRLISLLRLRLFFFFFFFNDTATTEIYTLSLHDALPISARPCTGQARRPRARGSAPQWLARAGCARACRARARGLLARCSDPEGPVRDAGAHRGAAQDAARAVAARWSRGATRRRVHRLRPGHRGAAAVRARCGRRGSRRATTCAPERRAGDRAPDQTADVVRSEEHTSELQSPCNLVCRLLLEKKKQKQPRRDETRLE